MHTGKNMAVKRKLPVSKGKTRKKKRNDEAKTEGKGEKAEEGKIKPKRLLDEDVHLAYLEEIEADPDNFKAYDAKSTAKRMAKMREWTDAVRRPVVNHRLRLYSSLPLALTNLIADYDAAFCPLFMPMPVPADSDFFDHHRRVYFSAYDSMLNTLRCNTDTVLEDLIRAVHLADTPEAAKSSITELLMHVAKILLTWPSFKSSKSGEDEEDDEENESRALLRGPFPLDQWGPFLFYFCFFLFIYPFFCRCSSYKCISTPYI